MSEGHKIFISYKYWDFNVETLPGKRWTKVRDYVSLVEKHFKMTEDVYKGEHDDEDLNGLDEDTVWSKLKDRIFDSSVTIVMISPGMRDSQKMDKSQWIPWEISYSLKETTRNDRTSHSNAVFAVVLPDVNGKYDYFIERRFDYYAGSYNNLKTDRLFTILRENMFNQIGAKKKYFESIDSTIYYGESSYMFSVRWSDFAENPQKYIDRAVGIKENIDCYQLTKEL